MFKPTPTPLPPPPAVADTEFLEAVAKTWRQRYQAQQAQPSGQPLPAPRREQAA